MVNEPPEVTVFPANQTVIGGRDVVFYCNTSGIPTPTVRWDRLGGALPENAMVTNGALTFVSMGTGDAGVYTCTATNTEGSANGNVRLEVIGEWPRDQWSFACVVVPSLTLSLLSSKRTFSQPFREKCVSNVVSIGSIIIFHLSKLWKAEFSILCDVIFLVCLQGKFDIGHSWEWKNINIHLVKL